jgi:hypothetical protein
MKRILFTLTIGVVIALLTDACGTGRDVETNVDRDGANTMNGDGGSGNGADFRDTTNYGNDTVGLPDRNRNYHRDSVIQDTFLNRQRRPQ